MGETVKGIIHVHSDFSRDGFHSVADLSDYARESGFRFVGLTDHAEDLAPEDMEIFRQECAKYSDESVLMIPGLEFRCREEIHILGLGITDHIPSSDAVTVATQIGVKGGLAILAHPGRNGYEYPRELCSVLNGIEIWNARYDGRFAPPLAKLRLIQGARSANPSIFAFGGADLHWLQRPPGVMLQLAVNGSTGLNADVILQLLRSGRFSVYGRFVSFDSGNGPDRLARFQLWAFRRLYEVSKAIRDIVFLNA